ncbi:Heat stress transcription factor A-7a [Raphanus sativus]|nr:Heat stress transcription factor A-7a [Raphanus sativus]
MAGRVKEYYRYPALEASHKGLVRRYFADVLYEIVDDPKTDSIVSWSQDGKSFIFWNQDKFCSDILLPKYGLTTFPTFIGRLSVTYRFRKVEESEHCEYAHDYFVRGKPELTVEIERQFKERCAPIKNIKPPEPGSREIRERRMALILAQKAARNLSIL